MLICMKTTHCKKLDGHSGACGKTAVTAPDVRTAAQAEAERIRFRLKGHDYPANRHFKLGFADGAVWGAALVTPTRRQLVDALAVEFHEGDPQSAADAVLALMHRSGKGTGK